MTTPSTILPFPSGMTDRLTDRLIDGHGGVSLSFTESGDVRYPKNLPARMIDADDSFILL